MIFLEKYLCIIKEIYNFAVSEDKRATENKQHYNNSKITIMKCSRTPAQEYAQKIIERIDANDYAAVLDIILSRPMTLRNAMNHYLYKSITKQIAQRKRYIV